ncbi:hypothetical protein FF1_031009 [Malus domestica]
MSTAEQPPAQNGLEPDQTTNPKPEIKPEPVPEPEDKPEPVTEAEVRPEPLLEHELVVADGADPKVNEDRSLDPTARPRSCASGAEERRRKPYIHDDLELALCGSSADVAFPSEFLLLRHFHVRRRWVL